MTPRTPTLTALLVLSLMSLVIGLVLLAPGWVAHAKYAKQTHEWNKAQKAAQVAETERAKAEREANTIIVPPAGPDAPFGVPEGLKTAAGYIGLYRQSSATLQYIRDYPERITPCWEIKSPDPIAVQEALEARHGETPPITHAMLWLLMCYDATKALVPDNFVMAELTARRIVDYLDVVGDDPEVRRIALSVIAGGRYPEFASLWAKTKLHKANMQIYGFSDITGKISDVHIQTELQNAKLLNSFSDWSYKLRSSAEEWDNIEGWTYLPMPSIGSWKDRNSDKIR